MSNILEYLQKNDTIAAISTAQGAGGIGIIRISGPDSWKIAWNILVSNDDKEFQYENIQPNKMELAYVKDPAKQNTLDQALCVFFKGPRSYTGQDTVELQCHGGPAVLENILELVRRCGARQAGPGEFTYRAFKNGKMDLGQAEAVCSLIDAANSTQAMIALANLREGMSEEIGGVRKCLVEALAALDAAIDFPDEMEEILTDGFSREIKKNACEPLEKMIRRSRENKVFEQGASVVICGRPNVGKSSLFNAILGRERALVYEKAGTTRDSLEEGVNLGGVACRMTDTAGVGEAADEIEALGMGISRERIEGADICLVVLDGSQELTVEDLEILDQTNGRERLIVVNKADKEDSWKIPAKIGTESEIVAVSAKKGTGLEQLSILIRQKLTKGQAEPDPGKAVVNQRQAEKLEMCLESCLAAIRKLERQQEEVEIASLEISQALDHLGEVDGVSATDLVLEEIFSKFCVGK